MVNSLPVITKMRMVIIIKMRCTANLEMLVNVGMVETGYFILVTR